MNGLFTLRFVLLSVHQVKGDFVLILALASNNLSVFSPQGPTEGCGVIPVKGRRMCTDLDPGGPTLNASFCSPELLLIPLDPRCCTIPLILCRRAY